jgi:hypothetical protein
MGSTEPDENSVDYWNITVYDDDGQERETLRGLTYSRVDALLDIFERENIQARASAYDENGCSVSEGVFSVNWRESTITND